jgi:hypothetical protein
MELKTDVPTYCGNARDDGAVGRHEFGDPYVPTIVRTADGLRIVLGSHDYFDANAPDVQIERRPRGWAIFLHPVGGGQASGLLIFLDDGRSFLIPERDVSSTHPTVPLEPGATISDLDDMMGMQARE